MVVGEQAEGVDLLIVGAGPGGYTAALEAARLGRDVTLVDRDGDDGVGGVCVRSGCVPSKALLEVADAVVRVRSLEPAGVRTEGVTLDLAAFQRWRSDQVAGLAGAVRRQLRQAGVRVVAGDLRFTRPDRVVVQAAADGPPTFFEFADAIIATGATAVTVPGLPRDGTAVLDPADVLALEVLPERVAVIGGDYIGVELATALAKLGSVVTIVEAAARLLPAMNAVFERPLRRGLDALGVRVHLGARATGYGDGRLAVDSEAGGAHIDADRVVVSVGRRPATAALGLERLGVAPGADGRLPVAADRRLTPHVAAIGDVTPGPPLAHKAYAEARVAVAALCGRRAAFAPVAVPEVVASDPQLSTAGLSAEEAKAAGLDVATTRLPLRASGRAATMGARHGFVQLVVDTDADAVVGVQIAGPNASELIAEGVLAIEMAASPTDLAASIHPHPTLSELISDAARAAQHRR